MQSAGVRLPLERELESLVPDRVERLPTRRRRRLVVPAQGYLAHKKPRPPSTQVDDVVLLYLPHLVYRLWIHLSTIYVQVMHLLEYRRCSGYEFTCVLKTEELEPFSDFQQVIRNTPLLGP